MLRNNIFQISKSISNTRSYDLRRDMFGYFCNISRASFHSRASNGLIDVRNSIPNSIGSRVTYSKKYYQTSKENNDTNTINKETQVITQNPASPQMKIRESLSNEHKIPNSDENNSQSVDSGFVSIKRSKIFRILAIGGAGASGKLLCYRLAWSDISPSISIIGRKSIKGIQITERLDSSTNEKQSHDYHTIDVEKDLELLREHINQVDLVINLVPSFNSIEIPRLCVEEGVNYMDMVSGIENEELFIKEFDTECKKKGIVLITGASLSPGLSTCIVDKYASEFDILEGIEVIFSQGNRSIKGKSTLESTFKRIGMKVNYLEDGEIQEIIGGSKTKKVTFPGFPSSRIFSISMNPEISIFKKKYPNLKSLYLYSGFEVKAIQFATILFSYLTKWGIVKDWGKYSKPLTKLTGLFRWFGTYDGAIQVILSGKKFENDQNENSNTEETQSKKSNTYQISSTIVALNGHDTQVPITPIYILTHKLVQGELKSGAYACTGLFTLDEFLNALHDFNVFEVRNEGINLSSNNSPMIAQAIGNDYWDMVPKAVRDFYSSKGGFTSGLLTVERNKSRLSNLLADWFHLPSASETTRLSIESSNYVFKRYFVEEDDLHLKNPKPFISSMYMEGSKDGLVRESYTQFTYGYRYKRIPSIDEDHKYGWEFSTKKVWLKNIPIPRWLTLTPKGKVIPTSSPNRWYIESAWTNPLFSRPIVKFRGILERKELCIGIDIGGCISTSVQETNDYLSDLFLKAPPVEGSFESIRELVKVFGGENIYIVSQASFPVALRKSEWFGYHKFFEKTGVPRENVIFLADSNQKSEACRMHHIRFFIDNRLEVLERIQTMIPEMKGLLWLQTSDDYEQLSKGSDLKIKPCKTWNDALKKLKEEKNEL